jgi:hypothetical protein
MEDVALVEVRQALSERLTDWMRKTDDTVAAEAAESGLSALAHLDGAV